MGHDDDDVTRSGRPSVPAMTYTARPDLEGKTLRCTRCGRVYAFPEVGAPVRCECGWWYENTGGGELAECFKPRL